jgi:hypothetical protein
MIPCFPRLLIALLHGTYVAGDRVFKILERGDAPLTPPSKLTSTPFEDDQVLINPAPVIWD